MFTPLYPMQSTQECLYNHMKYSARIRQIKHIKFIPIIIENDKSNASKLVTRVQTFEPRKTLALNEGVDAVFVVL